MLELLINLVIIGVIIYSVIKRAQEVAEQGKKNAGPPTVPTASPAGPPSGDKSVPGPLKKSTTDPQSPHERAEHQVESDKHTPAGDTGNDPRADSWDVPEPVRDLLRERKRRLADIMRQAEEAIGENPVTDASSEMSTAMPEDYGEVREGPDDEAWPKVYDEEKKAYHDDLPAYDAGRTPEPLPTGTAPRRSVVDEQYLRFGRTDIVRGIIMKEVLGPPVSMRRFEDYGGSAW